MEVLRQGAATVLNDALIHLNAAHLNRDTPTLYEDLARSGMKSGSINGLIFRGKTAHELSIPEWVERPLFSENIRVHGPDLLTLGAITDPFEGVRNLPDGITNKLGFTNEYAVQAAVRLVQTDQLPDFLYVYLPDMDRHLHKKGPTDSVGLKKTDRQLQTLLDAFGSGEKALEKAVFIVMGDSGMTQLLTETQDSVIDLPALLTDPAQPEMRILRSGETPSDETDLVLAVNEAMAYVYPLKTDHTMSGLAGRIVADERIDFAAWKENGWIHVVQGGSGKRLRYQAGGDLTDPYDQQWTVAEDGSVLDLAVDGEQRTIRYGEFPDGLRRLWAALHSHEGEYLVVTAKPGYELADRSSLTHEGGGAHGSLRRAESLVPLIISGTEQKPPSLRVVDLKGYLLELLQYNRDSSSK